MSKSTLPLSLLLLISSTASAESFHYSGFASTPDLTINGDAAVVTSGSDAVLRLVAAANNQGGSAFRTTVYPAAAFETRFSFRITNPGGFSDSEGRSGADGFAFVIQPNSNSVGGVGGGMGYAGVTNSVAIEFDTWKNESESDPDGNHVAIHYEGVTTHTSGDSASLSDSMESGNLWTVWVDYNGTTMSVYMTEGTTRPATPTLQQDVDLTATLVDGSSFIGFTAATGGAYENIDIVDWEFFGNEDSECLSTFAYGSFNDTTGLITNGAAAAQSTADGMALCLTPASRIQGGNFLHEEQKLAGEFKTDFAFRITNPGGFSDSFDEQGGDGFAFLIQTHSDTFGSAGGGLGYAGIPQSVAVEFDTWHNADLSDPSSNHIGIMVDGSTTHVSGDSVDVAENFDNGELWHAWVEYDGTKLDVYADMSTTRPASPLLSQVIDIPAILGAERAWVGFSSATGEAYEQACISAWEYTGACDPTPDEGGDDGDTGTEDTGTEDSGGGDGGGDDGSGDDGSGDDGSGDDGTPDETPEEEAPAAEEGGVDKNTGLSCASANPSGVVPLLGLAGMVVAFARRRRDD